MDNYKNIVVASQQPEHLPWLGLINKISKCDIFVILDTAQYEDSNFQNRNKIRNQTGWQWITVPIGGSKIKPIKDILISEDKKWKQHYIRVIENQYQKANCFNKYFPEFKQIMENSENSLSELNTHILLWMLEQFNFPKPQIIKASELNLNTNLRKTDMVVDLIKKAGGTEYLSGMGAKTYLEKEKFDSAGLKLSFNQFESPIYMQLHDPFIPNLSSLDFLFNCGNILPYGDLSDKGCEAIKLLLKKINFKPAWTVLEMFGGDGTGHSRAYAFSANEIEMWELDNMKCGQLREKYPWAVVKNVDTFKEMKNCTSQYDLVLMDPPTLMSSENLVPEGLKFVRENGWVIIRVIKKPHTPHNAIIPFSGVKEIEESNYIILNKRIQVREFYGFNDWSYHYAYQIGKRK